jgi:hypothetical protein
MPPNVSSVTVLAHRRSNTPSLLTITLHGVNFPAFSCVG